jgi:hypothetical protein
MTNDRMVMKLHNCKPVPTGLAGSPKRRWESNIKEVKG